MCFLWITIDNKPWHEYTNEFRRHKEKLDPAKIRVDVQNQFSSV